ncbi:MAG: amidohydrolase [Chloroflexi bacterium]|nr:MAG: amidohydrolase [Chloroflexota bacterium]
MSSSLIDTIVFNGDIVTLDAHTTRVSALALHNGRVVAAGSDDDILPLAGSDTQRYDLDGRFVIPGLTDAHIHWQGVARALHQVDVFEVESKQVAVERVAEYAQRLASGEWIIGHGWVQDIWPGKAFPSAADLDSVTPNHPVYLRAKSGHAAWVNSLAMRLVGINADTPDPDGGQIVRDANGAPTGILLETAMDLVADKIPSQTAEQLAEQMKAAQTHALSAGLTGIHDFDDPLCLQALQILRERDELSIRVVKNINQAFLPAALESGLRWGFGDEWLRIGGLKLFSDGALGPRTAYMIEPYIGEPNNYGIPVIDKEEMIELVQQATLAGLPSTIHAIGDRAVHDVLDVYQAARRVEHEHHISRTSRRHRIEHVQIVHPDDAHRLAELNLIASMQPIHATSDYIMADTYWGERSRFAYNPRLQIDQGVVVAFGSDAPVEPLHPLKGIHAAVTRQRPDGSPGPDGWYPDARLTLDEALHGFTTGPAYAAGMESSVGKLAPGYLADLVVLSEDLYAIPPSDILHVDVIATMVGGEWRYGEM